MMWLLGMWLLCAAMRTGHRLSNEPDVRANILERMGESVLLVFALAAFAAQYTLDWFQEKLNGLNTR